MEADSSFQLHRSLRLLNFYRLLIVAFLLIGFISELTPNYYGVTNPPLYVTTILIYGVFGLFVMWTTAKKNRVLSGFVPVSTGADIIAILLIIHSSGGVTSGLGSLLLVAVAGASLLMTLRTAVVTASIASIVLLLDETFGQLYGYYDHSAYTHAGVLGLGIFLTSILAATLANRTRKSEALAAQRGADLANMAELNEQIIRSINAGIMVLDSQQRVRSMNHAAAAMLSTDAKSSDYIYNLSPALSEQLQHWLEKTDTNTHLLKNTHQEDIQASFTLLGNAAESNTLIYLENVAEISQKMHQENLQSLGRLTASIAHEIRNPLTAISHAAQLLEEDLPKAEQRLVGMILDNSNRIDALVQDVLSLSRKDSVHTETLQIRDWIEGFIDEFARYQHMNIERFNLQLNSNQEVRFDRRHLHQVMWNLCDNARIYAPADESELFLTLYVHDDPHSHFQYWDVCDSGQGIEPDIRSKLFEPFFTTGQQGTGLGLHISRQLCQLNGGQLSYLPSETGSCFRLTLPTQ